MGKKHHQLLENKNQISEESEHQNSNQINSYKENLIQVINKSNDDFEKQLSFISAGALALSIAFMDKLAKDLSVAQSRWLLVGGWIFLALTLLSNLISHIYSSNLHNKTLKEVQEGYDDYYKNSITRNRKINHLNFFSISTLVIGLILIIIFSSINLFYA